MTKYKDILAPEILNLFSESERKIIREMDLTDNGSEKFEWNGETLNKSEINIRKMVKKLGFAINYVLADFESNDKSEKNKVMLINQTGAESRQRMQIAFTLGMYLFYKQNPQLKDTTVINTPINLLTSFCNQFTYEILMPKKLILNQMKRYKQLLELINNQKIKSKDIDVSNLIWFLSQDLGVGRLTIKYRLLNLNYIV